MTVKDAREAAQRWVQEEARHLPGFYGAFYHGSTNWLADDAPFPPTSDMDVMVVLDGADPPERTGKFLYHDILLEASYLPLGEIASAEQVLGHYHLAGSFRAPGILMDPSGHLAALQAAVSRDYARRPWVVKRCEHARDNILNHLRGLETLTTFHEQVMAWLFAAGVTTHVLLVAGLKNPTVRRRYLSVRELLADYHRLDFHETLLEMLGCAHMTPERTEQHLATLAEAFDAAGAVRKTPYRFAADLTPLARPIAIDGSREMIAQGYHREAIFWMVATYSRCQWVFHHDASPEMQAHFTDGYRRLVADLGITSFADLRQRGEQVRDSLPVVWGVAEAILAANPAILPAEGSA